MTIQTVPYTDAPDIGYPGLITDIFNPYITRHSVAEEQLDVGIAVAKGTDITDEQSQIGFKVKLPETGETILGVTVRVYELEGKDLDLATTVPVYKIDQLVTYLTKGAIYIKALKAIPVGMNPAYVKNIAGGDYSLGDILPDDDSARAVLMAGWYFEKATAINNIVKLIIT